MSSNRSRVDVVGLQNVPGEPLFADLGARGLVPYQLWRLLRTRIY